MCADSVMAAIVPRHLTRSVSGRRSALLRARLANVEKVSDTQVEPRTATPATIAPWLAELARNLPGVAPSFGLPPVLDLRTRLRLHIAIDRTNSAHLSLWVHESLGSFMGEGTFMPADDVIVGYAEQSAQLGKPADDEALRHALPDEVVGVVRATVARMQIAALLLNSAQCFAGRFVGRLPRSPRKLVVEGATALAIAPVLAPVAAVAGAARALASLAPPMPEVNTPPDDENLLVGLIAQAMPALLANAAVRSAALNLPAMLVVGVRSGRSSATVRIGRGVVAVDSGIAPSAQIVVDGDAAPLLRYASSRIARDVSGAPAEVDPEG